MMTDIEIPVQKSWVYRLFEMVPAIVSITMILMPLILSLVSVPLAVYFIVLYVVVWFVRSIAMSLRLVQGYTLMRRSMTFDWKQGCADLDATIDEGKPVVKDDGALALDPIAARHRKNMNRLVDFPESELLKTHKIRHCVIIAIYNESEDVLRPTLERLVDSNFDLKKLDIYIAYEQRGPQATRDMIKRVSADFEDKFGYFKCIGHPDGLKYEVRGKGGNITYTGWQASRDYEKRNIDKSEVIITTLDSDNRPDPMYFHALSYSYAVSRKRIHKSYQPMAIYTNNIWDVPAPMRVLASSNSFWWILVSTRPHLMRNFSAHSQPLAALERTKFWSTRSIVEDGHQYWRSYFAFDGDYEVVSVMLPIYQDAVLSSTYRQTFKAQFVQLRRWSYGASDVPYVATKLFKDKKLNKLDGLQKLLRLLESHVSWASASILIAMGGLAPLYLGRDVEQDIIVQQLPIFVSGLTNMSLLGVVISFTLMMFILPTKPDRYNKGRYFWMLAQWALVPLVYLGYMSLAALNSQIRLLTGNYLDEFDTTDKHVK